MPSKTWKVYCVDTFDGTRWLDGEYNTREEAEQSARFRGGTMLRAHVESPRGERINSYGQY